MPYIAFVGGTFYMCLMFYGMIRKDSWKSHPRPVETELEEQSAKQPDQFQKKISNT